MKKLNTYIFLVMATLISFSCSKELSEPPKNARVEGEVISDQKTAQVALNGAYYQFAQVTTDNITSWTSHHIAGGMFTGMLGYAFGSAQDESNLNASSSYASSIWSESYLVVSASNAVIDGVTLTADNAFTGTRKNEILGEAKFLRAYANFKLLFFFAEWFNPDSKNGVLLRDKLATLSTVQKARSSVAESYKSILEDLDFAILNAPAVNPNYYVTKYAAMALKMRVLMQRGQSADYAEVISLANAIIGSPNYALEGSLKDLFYTKGLSSKEVILGVKPQPNQEAFFFILSRSYYPFASNGYVAKKAFKDLLANDPRGNWMVGPVTPYQQYSPNTNYFTKYIAFGSPTSQLTETSYAFRLSEVYLLQAEAIIRSGGSLASAKTIIKNVMGKAGVSDFTAVDNANTPDELLKQNYYEILRNLTGEDAIEWMALLRFPLAVVTQLRPTVTMKSQFYFPVPTAEFQQNPLFGLQNEGYSN